MFKAVIFDFDGVITDSEILHFRAFNKVLKKYGIKIKRKEYYKEYLGLSDKDLFSLFAQQGKIPAEDISSLIIKKNKIFEKMARSNGHIIDGVDYFLNLLRKEDVPMTICSGALKPEIKLVLDKSGFEDYFSGIVSAEDVEKGKPDPEGFLKALEILKAKMRDDIKAGECVVIEDSHWGIDAANAAGMKTVAITNSYDAEKLSSADMIVRHLSELTIDNLKDICS